MYLEHPLDKGEPESIHSPLSLVLRPLTPGQMLGTTGSALFSLSVCPLKLVNHRAKAEKRKQTKCDIQDPDSPLKW